MRKSLWITAVLLLLGVSAAVVAYIWVNGTGEKVEIEETVLYGDRSVLEGLVVSHRITDEYNGHLYWDTCYRPGTEEKPVTDFWYSETPYREELPENRGVELYLASSVSGMSSGAIDFTEEYTDGWERVYADVASRTGAGKVHEEMVELQEYFLFYPMSIRVDIGNYHYYSGGIASQATKEVAEKLIEAFRVPVVEGSRARVSITKHADGTVGRYEMEMRSGMPNVSMHSILTEECCYLVVSGEMEDGSPLDTSYMIGGLGVYRLPYETKMVEDRETTQLYPDEMEMVYPIRGGEEVLSVLEDAERNRILIFTRHKEEELCVLKVVEMGTMETLQELSIAGISTEMWLSNVIRKEDILIPVFHETESGGNQFVLLALNEKGLYESQFSSEFPKSVEGNDFVEIDADYDGERLAIGVSVPYYYGPSCEFFLAVYEEGELGYWGKYASSLGIGTMDSSRYCMTWGSTPLEVKWE